MIWSGVLVWGRSVRSDLSGGQPCPQTAVLPLNVIHLVCLVSPVGPVGPVCPVAPVGPVGPVRSVSSLLTDERTSNGRITCPITAPLLQQYHTSTAP